MAKAAALMCASSVMTTNGMYHVISASISSEESNSVAYITGVIMWQRHQRG